MTITPPEQQPPTSGQQIPLQGNAPSQVPGMQQYPPPQGLPFGAPIPTRQNATSLRWWQHSYMLAGITVLALFVGVSIGVTAKTPQTNAASVKPAPAVTVTRTVPAPAVTVPGPAVTVPGPTVTVPGPTVTVTAPAAAPVPAAGDASAPGGTLYSGSGSGITNSKTFSASGQISIDYSYSNCQIPGFSIYVEGADSQDIPVTKDDSSGSGTAISYISGDVHLVMNTACHWRVSVTG